MWKCANCGEEVEASFDVCWNCGTGKDGTRDPHFAKEGEETSGGQDSENGREGEEGTGGQDSSASVSAENGQEIHPLSCPRCDLMLNYVGTKSFHEGTRWGVLGDLGELFVNKERFDIYCCPRCGRVKFFVDGIGEEFRPH